MWLFKKKEKISSFDKFDIEYKRKHGPENTPEGLEPFIVGGAGTLGVGKCVGGWSAGSYGFSIGVSWGQHGYSGGVLGINEAKRLAEHILEQLKYVEGTEQENSDRALNRLRNE